MSCSTASSSACRVSASAFSRPALTISNIGLADESVGEQAREPVRLGDGQGGLHTFFQGEVELAAEEVEAAELCGEDGEVASGSSSASTSYARSIRASPSSSRPVCQSTSASRVAQP